MELRILFNKTKHT